MFPKTCNAVYISWHVCKNTIKLLARRMKILTLQLNASNLGEGEKVKEEFYKISEMTIERCPTLSATMHTDVLTCVYLFLVIRFNCVQMEVNFVHLSFFLFHFNKHTTTQAGTKLGCFIRFGAI